MGEKLKLREVRRVFRLIGEVRELAADPNQWRPHLVKRLRKLLGAAVVVSSEVHLRPSSSRDGSVMRVIDIGWGCDADDHVWEFRNEGEGRPETFMLERVGKPEAADVTFAAARPTQTVRAGGSFMLSQYPLAHLGAVDQLGVHQMFGREHFTAAQHRLLRLLHVELGRLWMKDALKDARDPNCQLPPRLAQTLAALQDGCSEKEVSNRLGISQHTVHNYVKALHRRLGVSSRGELLARTPQPNAFLPKLSVPRD